MGDERHLYPSALGVGEVNLFSKLLGVHRRRHKDIALADFVGDVNLLAYFVKAKLAADAVAVAVGQTANQLVFVEDSCDPAALKHRDMGKVVLTHDFDCRADAVVHSAEENLVQPDGDKRFYLEARRIAEVIKL